LRGFVAQQAFAASRCDNVFFTCFLDRLTVAADKRNSDKRRPDPPASKAGAPVVALLFDPAARPGLAEIAALAERSDGFALTHRDEAAGHAELLRDGLPFDCLGLAPGGQLQLDTALQQIALPGGCAPGDLALVTLSPGAQLAGAGQLLPVVRMISGLVLALGALPGLRAVAWLPARLAMSPDWFAEAVGAWLHGGPFPALALTALARTEHGFASRGLAYFTGQEFVFAGKDGILRERDARGAVRLTDWLVAHGRIEAACEVELPGFGTVLIEPDGPDSLCARSL